MFFTKGISLTASLLCAFEVHICLTSVYNTVSSFKMVYLISRAKVWQWNILQQYSGRSNEAVG